MWKHPQKKSDLVTGYKLCINLQTWSEWFHLLWAGSPTVSAAGFLFSGNQKIVYGEKKQPWRHQLQKWVNCIEIETAQGFG